jgi:hypothetical protein
MKKLIFMLIALSFLLVNCEEGSVLCPAVPGPSGTPDDTTTYEDGPYKTVTYIYHCLNGKYQAITWTRTVKCGSWTKSVYTAECI